MSGEGLISSMRPMGRADLTIPDEVHRAYWERRYSPPIDPILHSELNKDRTRAEDAPR